MVEAEVLVDRDSPTYGGQAGYTKSVLSLYGVLFRINFNLLWKCPKAIILEHYSKHLSSNHLDVGVANGQLLDESNWPVEKPSLTLMDLNPNSLEHAAHRLRCFAPKVHQANVLSPWELPSKSFESVGMFNLLHCLPGTMATKARAFEYASTVLAQDGVFFGVTLLGDGVPQNRLARRRLATLNRQGHFTNLEDNAVDLEDGLAKAFGSCEVRVQGMIALFSAEEPLTQK